MPQPSLCPAAKTASSEWDRYLALPIPRSVLEQVRTWYRSRVEAFLKALRLESPPRLTTEQMTG